MLKIANRRVFVALLLMAFLVLGSVAAEARDRDTGGSDRMVKGAAAGAVVGAVTQAARGMRGVDLLKGAAVGASVGAAVGAYSDYKQEKDARHDEERRADHYEARSHRRHDRYDRGDRYRDDHRRGRAHRAANRHRHHRGCGHR